MKSFALLVLLLLMAMVARAQTNFTAFVSIPELGISNTPAYLVIGTPRSVSSFTNRIVPLDTDEVGYADPVSHTNIFITWGQIRSLIDGRIPPFPPVQTNFLKSIFTNNTEVIAYPWAGPTNSLSLLTNYYTYTALKSCSITGYVFDAGFVSRSMLTITNASGSNITFTTTVNGPQEDASLTYTITNNYVLKSWIEFDGAQTNQVTRVFKH